MIQPWSVYVEWPVNARALEDLMDTLADALADHSAVVGEAPNGNLHTQLSVKAPTLIDAIKVATLALNEAASTVGINQQIACIEAMTEEELDRRNSTPQIPELAGMSEVGQLLGVTRQRANQLAQREDFPPAVAALRSGPVFVADQVKVFERRWERTAGRPAKNHVRLSEIEKALVTALAHAALEGTEQHLGTDLSISRHHAALALWGRLNTDRRNALDRLFKLRILAEPVSIDVPDNAAALVELTEKGAQVAERL